MILRNVCYFGSNCPHIPVMQSLFEDMAEVIFDYLTAFLKLQTQTSSTEHNTLYEKPQNHKDILKADLHDVSMHGK